MVQVEELRWTAVGGDYSDLRHCGRRPSWRGRLDIPVWEAASVAAGPIPADVAGGIDESQVPLCHIMY